MQPSCSKIAKSAATITLAKATNPILPAISYEGLKAANHRLSVCQLGKVAYVTITQ